jgi:hypothetical protein
MQIIKYNHFHYFSQPAMISAQIPPTELITPVRVNQHGCNDILNADFSPANTMSPFSVCSTLESPITPKQTRLHPMVCFQFTFFTFIIL